jgi:hypothetical protein
MGYNTTPLVLHTVGRPAWLPDERFWYRTPTAGGSEFVLFDAVHQGRQPAISSLATQAGFIFLSLSCDGIIESG